jgi:integrase
MHEMKLKFRIFQRSSGIYFIEDRETGNQESLRTRDKTEASRLLHARNEAEQQPQLNLQIARAYLLGADPGVRTRTWQAVMDELEKGKTGATLERWIRAMQDKAFASIRDKVLLETRATDLLRVLEKGRISTNVFLRRLHNFALDLGWIPTPILAKPHWPALRYKEKRAITGAEHHKIVGIEWVPERKTFYELLWHLGGSQSDVASLTGEDIDWENKTIAYQRSKTKVIAMLRFSATVEKLLRSLPAKGFLLPHISQMHEKHRAAEFKRRCTRLKISGITLHSYRYAWAERAKRAGYPERFAQQALGHNSQAVHRAYARKAEVMIPCLEEFENRHLRDERADASK